MKKLGWYAVSAVVAAFILGGGLLLAANLYVQSRAVQHRIRQALSASLRMPVSLRKTTFTPWEGLRIDGITGELGGDPSRGEAGSSEVNLLTAHSFRLQFAILPLLRKQFVINDILLDRPRLSWVQDLDSRWRLPYEKVGTKGRRDHPGTAPVPPNPSSAPAGTAVPPPDRTAVSPVLPGKNPEVDPPTVPDFVPPRQVAIDKFRLRHGNMDFLNRRRGLLGRFEEVNVDGSLVDPDHATGVAQFEKAVIPRAGLKLGRFQSGFSYDHAAGLTLNDATAMLAGGTLCADCHIRTSETGTPYDARCRMENISLAQLIKSAGGNFGLIDGTLQGNLDVSGVTDDPEKSNAAGEIRLVDAEIRNLPLFQAIGSALRIDDLQHLQFKTARLVYRVEGSTVEVQPLVLVSNNLQITARGRYLVGDDRLDLHARLMIDESVSRQLPRIVEQQFTPCGDEMPGSRFIDFDIKGPISKPSNNLYQRMLPNTINGLLDRWLRPHPKRTKDQPTHPVEKLSPPVQGNDT